MLLLQDHQPAFCPTFHRRCSRLSILKSQLPEACRRFQSHHARAQHRGLAEATEPFQSQVPLVLAETFGTTHSFHESGELSHVEHGARARGHCALQLAPLPFSRKHLWAALVDIHRSLTQHIAVSGWVLLAKNDLPSWTVLPRGLLRKTVDGARSLCLHVHEEVQLPQDGGSLQAVGRPAGDLLENPPVHEPWDHKELTILHALDGCSTRLVILQRHLSEYGPCTQSHDRVAEA
mmetsp:Transcript_43988/g.102636  ORF Transcript_43988/g.102636 Transcript_43988/m.102636 type:complete len:234 (-) Transcript_43988:1262-1963(-)